MDPFIVVRVFIGRSYERPEAAAMFAAAQLNDWEPLQIRSADAHPLTVVQTSITRIDDEWMCTITATGYERRERAYTGKTERLG